VARREPPGVRGTHPYRRLEERVAEALQPQPGGTILVAASGGPDSMALARLADKAARAAGARLVLGHVNHGTRERAWQDEGVTLAAGARLGVRVLCASVDAGADEASLRDARYGALAALAETAGAPEVWTAHHARDQAETVLLALLRGTGPDGMVGIRPRRPLTERVDLVRPLLRVDPADLLAYCRDEQLPYARDGSNADPAYRRNALRVALAALRVDFPHLDEAVARCAEILRDERDATDRGRMRASLRLLLAERGVRRDVTLERVDAALALLERGTAGRVFLGSGTELVVE
jgi:tRNA(Ile)-lysidine synthase